MPKGETRGRNSRLAGTYRDPNRQFMRWRRGGGKDNLDQGRMRLEDSDSRKAPMSSYGSPKPSDKPKPKKTKVASSPAASSGTRRRPGGSSPKTTATSTGRRRPGK